MSALQAAILVEANLIWQSAIRFRHWLFAGWLVGAFAGAFIARQSRASAQKRLSDTVRERYDARVVLDCGDRCGMLQTSADFANALVRSKLFSKEEVQAFCQALPANNDLTGAKGFAEWLTLSEKLTPFQADEILLERKTPLVLGEYVLLDRLGSGGMGEVYKAHHRKLERIAAIKMIAPGITSETIIKRFLREGKAAAKLSHDNIVTTYDASESDGHHFLAMEFIDGTNLHELAKKKLPPEEAVNYVLQAAAGLEHAHAQGIIHRDIKPLNLMVDRNGKVRILDMGIARIDQALAEEGMTHAGEQMGTPDYMAPEQWSDIRKVDARCDIYSLGCTLYQLLTGQVMYEGGTAIAKARMHEEAPIPYLGDLCPTASAELEDVFRRMVAKKPHNRYATMTAVREALTAAQQKYARVKATRGSSTPWLGLLNAFWDPSGSSASVKNARSKSALKEPVSAIVVDVSEDEESDRPAGTFGTLAPGEDRRDTDVAAQTENETAKERRRSANARGAQVIGPTSRARILVGAAALAVALFAVGFALSRTAADKKVSPVPDSEAVQPKLPPKPIQPDNQPPDNQPPDNSWWFGSDLSPLVPSPGLQLTNVKQDSPVHNAGLRDEDRIYSINGVSMHSEADFDGVVEKSNGLLEVKFKRAGQAEFQSVIFELARKRPPPWPADVKPE